MPKTKVNTPFKAPRTARDKATKSDRNVDKVSNATGKVQIESADTVSEEVPITSQLEASKEPAAEIAEPSNKDADMIGKRVAKDFGSLGVFLGTIMSSEDEESYRPPKVYFVDLLHLVYSNIKSFLQLHLLETAKKEQIEVTFDIERRLFLIVIGERCNFRIVIGESFTLEKGR